MDNSPKLQLPYIAAAQAQKHVTHNEAIRALDVLVQASIVDRDLTVAPASPPDGSCYLVASGATGTWAGNDNAIAAWQDGAWQYYTPRTGWQVWVEDEEILIAWTGTEWKVASSEASNGSTALEGSMVGVNATADTTNRLSVKSDATLFTHDDVTPGSGDMRQVLNKAGSGNTVSQLYQSNWSGRAEVGLTGSDNLAVKVSADGSSWTDAMVIDASTGVVDFPAGSPTAAGTAVGTGGASGITPYVSNRTGANFHFWTRSVRRMVLHGERPRINMYGDSITTGTGGLTFKHTVAQLLADELTRRGLPARANLFGLPFGNVTNQQAYEPRLTFTGSWGPWTQVQGKTATRATSSGASVTYAPGHTFDRCDLHYIMLGVNLGDGGEFTITIDGGATAFSTPTSGGLVTSEVIQCPAQPGSDVNFTNFTIEIEGPAAVHTITLTNGTTGVFEIYGFEPWTSDYPEITIRAAAGSGLTSVSLATGPAAQSVYKLPCDLYMLNIGANDSATDVPVATYGDNLDTIEGLMRIWASSSILYWTRPPAATSIKPTAQQQTYVDEMVSRASDDIVVFDLFRRYMQRGGQEALAENSGGDWYDDAIHPSSWGHRDMARALADVILWQD